MRCIRGRARARRASRCPTPSGSRCSPACPCSQATSGSRAGYRPDRMIRGHGTCPPPRAVGRAPLSLSHGWDGLVTVAASGSPATHEEVAMEAHEEELGPIDIVVIAYPAGAPITGEAVPMLLDLVDRGIIRVLDAMFVI